MTFDMSQFLVTFYEESFEGLDVMESELLALDIGEADLETINTIFRAAHSIKGGSGTFGLNDVATFTHVMETLLDEMRDGKRDITKEGVNVLLESVDILREMLTTLQAEEDLDTARIAEVKAKLDKMLSGEDVNSENNTETSSSQNESVKENVDSTSESVSTLGWIIDFKPHVNMLQTGNDPVRMFRELKSLGEFTIELDKDLIPDFLLMEPENSYLSWAITLKGNIKKYDINEVFDWVDDECDLDVVAIEGEQSLVDNIKEEVTDTTSQDNQSDNNKSENKAKPKSTKKPTDKKKAAESSSIRVSIEKVDELINMVGELVITQSMLSQLGDRDEFNEKDIENLKAGLLQLERNTRELQENVMRIRMLPISFVFQRFPRLVHDLSSKLGKKIELKLEGESTELDKTVMEKIGDPLVHLVRNSLDHGIETPEIRLAAGKDETGIINLNAFHQGGNIVIEIKDDGAGLNNEKILSKAIENGIIQEGQDLTEDEIANLIFLPGFSTADVVSDVSGRGVGMDVVKRNIRSLGGTVEVKTEQGVGSTFTIRLPLTLAILDGQSILVGAESYIIPLVAIIESTQIVPNLVSGVPGNSEVYRLRDEYIPIIKLHKVFNISGHKEKLTDGLLVILEAEGQKIALLVDDLLGQQQVVIKSLETNFKKVDGVSGATILGDGTVALILDVVGLVGIARSTKKKLENVNINHEDSVAA